MSKKILVIALTIAFAAAMIGGATMAWFTDTASSEQVEFTAGTVEIVAGTSTTMESESGSAWALVEEQINPVEVVSNRQGTRPNGDSVLPQRSQVGTILQLDTGQSESNFYSLGFDMKEPYSNDPEQSEWLNRGGEVVVRFAEPVPNHLGLVIVVEDTWGAWPNEKAQVYVSQNNSDWEYVGDARNGIGTPQSYNYFDDIPLESFQYVKLVDVTDPYDFENKWDDNNNDGFDVNAILAGTLRWERSIWNPGDCDPVMYTVRNVGTKNAQIRCSSLDGQWYELDEESQEWVEWTPPYDVVSFELCNDTLWDEGNDGLFYYSETLGNGEEAELCVKICLDGPDTTNEFQGKRFVVTARFDAIQASHSVEWTWDGVDFTTGLAN